MMDSQTGFPCNSTPITTLTSPSISPYPTPVSPSLTRQVHKAPVQRGAQLQKE